MSKLLAIFYASLILFQSLNISFEDASKLSVLIEHATYHQETYGDSFVQFISEHYGASLVQHENEHSEHENLPFKHDGHNSCQAHTNFTLLHFDVLKPYETFTEIPFNFFYKESTSLFEKPSVFQPPQLA
ncbi:hypothetical protein MWU76_10600 [Gelidibacter sp. F2691]|nr:hypothetical protein [Gelidibacter sp. F2691]